MIWEAFSANGEAELVVMEECQNAQKYVKVLETILLPLVEVHHGPDFIFQLDNASIHTAKVTIKLDLKKVKNVPKIFKYLMIR